MIIIEQAGGAAAAPRRAASGGMTPWRRGALAYWRSWHDAAAARAPYRACIIAQRVYNDAAAAAYFIDSVPYGRATSSRRGVRAL